MDECCDSHNARTGLLESSAQEVRTRVAQSETSVERLRVAGRAAFVPADPLFSLSKLSLKFQRYMRRKHDTFLTFIVLCIIALI